MNKINPRRKRATANPDHRRRTHVPAPSDDEITARLNDLVKPALYAELDYYRQLGLRSGLLSLPVMLSLLLTLVWRRVPGVCDLTRMLAQERLLWAEPTKVSSRPSPSASSPFPLSLSSALPRPSSPSCPSASLPAPARSRP